jgi:hypothetical protein
MNPILVITSVLLLSLLATGLQLRRKRRRTPATAESRTAVPLMDDLIPPAGRSKKRRVIWTFEPTSTRLINRPDGTMTCCFDPLDPGQPTKPPTTTTHA